MALIYTFDTLNALGIKPEEKFAGPVFRISRIHYAPERKIQNYGYAWDSLGSDAAILYSGPLTWKSQCNAYNCGRIDDIDLDSSGRGVVLTIKGATKSKT